MAGTARNAAIAAPRVEPGALPPSVLPPSVLPLCVDLDGTLLATDSLQEAAIAACMADPRIVFALPGWAAQGKARLKEELSKRWDFDPAHLPYHLEFLAYLQEQRAQGRRLVLATATDRRIAQKIADHLNLFDEVIASEGTHNLGGTAKAAALVERFGAKGFIYAGNARADLAVWHEAAASVVVAAPKRVSAAAAAEAPVVRAIGRQGSLLRGLIRAMRPHQWVKNLLVFVPLFCAAAFDQVGSWVAALECFVGFCAIASAIYLLNDITDLASDRAHPRKSQRPFASGAVPISLGLALVPVLLEIGFALGWDSGAARDLALYAVLSLAYNLKLKEMPLVDVFVLAGLYTVRLFGGGEASGYPVSLWLLGFSSFMFLSLAFIKRVSELKLILKQQRRVNGRRGYMTQDLSALEMMGYASTFTSAVVLTLYVQSDTASRYYAHGKLLWAIVPLMLFWQCRLWLSTARGYMHDDPIVYAARDWVSWVVFAALITLVVSAWYLPVLT